MTTENVTMNAVPGLTRVRYEDHPAFAGVPFDDDPETAALASALGATLEQIRTRAKLPSTDVVHLLNSRIPPIIDPLFARLTERNGDLYYAADFFQRLKAKLIELIIQDYEVYADRGTHVYADHSETADSIAESLQKQGFWFGLLTPEAVQLLNDTVAEAKKTLWSRYENEKHIDREALTVNRWGGAEYSALAAVFNNEIVLNALSNYMGGSYVFMGCAFELSVPHTRWWTRRYGRDDESPLSAYYHNDESLRHPKMICYLCDVGETNGPTSLLPVGFEGEILGWIAGRALDHVREARGRDDVCSMDGALVATEPGRRVFARLPKAMRSLGHFGNDILAGSSQEAFILANRAVMTGGPGQFVLFDGARVPHRGGIVDQGHRWAFQVIYERKPA